MAVIRVGTRGSALALWQTHNVIGRLRRLMPEIDLEIIEIVSTGDRILDVPLAEVEGTGFFTATIEQALLDRRVDVAVHSCKDLPVEPTPGLVVAALPERGPMEDVLCARHGLTLGRLPSGARVGTCSARRAAQVRALRPDLDLQPLRGNVPTRVGRIASGELDAIVLARAGLVRLELESHITEIFPLDVMVPAPAQGAMAVQCRAQDAEVAKLLSALDDSSTRRAVTAERTLLHALGGGCSVPVGATARCEGAEVILSAGVFDIAAMRALRVEGRGESPVALGVSLAQRLLDLGAGEVLASFDKTARLDAPMFTGVGQ